MFSTWGVGDLRAPTVETYPVGGSVQQSTFAANQQFRIVVNADPQASKVLWWVLKNGDEFISQQELGYLNNGRLDIVKSFPTAAWYTIIVATPEGNSREFYPSNYTYVTIQPATTTTTEPVTTSLPAVSPTNTVVTTTAPRTPTSTVIEQDPISIGDPFYTPTSPITGLCPSGYYWDLLRWPEPGCSVQGSVVTGTPGTITLPGLPTSHTPVTTQQPTTQQPVYTPGAPGTQPAINTGNLSDFFSSSINILGVEVPIIALIGVLWFLK